MDDATLAEFLTNPEIAVQQYPRDRILDTDETNWTIVNNRIITVAECGAEGVSCQFEADTKGCRTVIASIDAAGSKLPLWAICRRKTIRCEADLREHFADEIRRGRLILTHQENGWKNAAVAGQYLEWLSRRVRGQNLLLPWDCFSAHRDEAVRSKAEDAHITIQFIPAGRTDAWQPLDLRIFASLKMRARRLFDDQWIRDGSGELTVAMSIALLLRAWDSIGQEEVLGAWEKLIPLS